MAKKWAEIKHKAGRERYVSMSSKKRFTSLPDFLREMQGRLYNRCECDGRGCTICISADALGEAADTLEGKAP